MKAKTQKTLERTVVIMLVLVFVLGTLLMYLPVGNQAAPPSPPPIGQSGVGAPPAAQPPAGMGADTVPAAGADAQPPANPGP